MATVIVHECDRCGYVVRMDQPYTNMNGWRRAEFKPAQSTDSSYNLPPAERLYCGKCTDEVQRALPRVASSALK